MGCKVTNAGIEVQLEQKIDKGSRKVTRINNPELERAKKIYAQLKNNK